MTKIGHCDCSHEYQDKIYGKGMRVFNNAPSKGSNPKRYRCTVCKKDTQL